MEVAPGWERIRHALPPSMSEPISGARLNSAGGYAAKFDEFAPVTTYGASGATIHPTAPTGLVATRALNTVGLSGNTVGAALVPMCCGHERGSL